MRRTASQQSPQVSSSSSSFNNPKSHHARRPSSISGPLTANSGAGAGSGAGTGAGTEEEDEEGTTRRPTRSKLGPLPRNSPANPLFPPLPPKPNKPSSRMNNNAGTGSGGSNAGGGQDGSQGGSVDGSPVSRRALVVDFHGVGSEGGDGGRLVDDATSTEEVIHPREPQTPPPPATYPEVIDDIEEKPLTPKSASGLDIPIESEVVEEGEEPEVDWDSYSKHKRQARSFRGSFGASAGAATVAPTGSTPQVPSIIVKREFEDTAIPLEAEEPVPPAPPSDLDSSLSSTTSIKGGGKTRPSGRIKPDPRDSGAHEISPIEAEQGNIVKSTRSTRSAVATSTRPTRGQTSSARSSSISRSKRGRGEDPKNPNPDEDEGDDASGAGAVGGDVEMDGNGQTAVKRETTVGDEMDMDVDEGKADVTRCVCGRDDIDVMMISCDVCQVWQHGACVGIWGDDEAPDEYYCEDCRPGLHAPLKRYLKFRAKHFSDGFVAPTPEDLKHHHYPSDRIKPSQSKRWTDPSVIKVPVTSGQPVLPHRSSSQRANAKSSRRDEETPPPSATASEFRRGISRRAGPTEGKPESSRSKSGGQPVRARRGSVSSREGSPPALASAPPKKRSTMNSRDAAYEAAIQASLAESGTTTEKGKVLGSASGGRGRSEPMDGEDVDMAMDAESMERARRGQKRKRHEAGDAEQDDERGDDGSDGDSSSVNSEDTKRSRPKPPVPGSRPKHPNQYTYRPTKKETTVTTQASRPVAEVEKKKPTQKSTSDAPKKEKVVIREPTPEVPADPDPIGPLSWNLPDHLQPFSHLLPQSHPVPLELVNPPIVDRRTGLVKDRDESYGPGLAPPLIRYEPPTKVRFPSKRVTVGEMRKRVRSVLEYVGRIQVEEVKRGERAKMLGLENSSSPASHDRTSEAAVPPQTMEAPSAAVPDPEVEEATRDQTAEVLLRHELSKSMRLMDELTRDLIKFQEMFESNGSWFAGGAATGPGFPGEGGGESEA